MFDKTSKGEKEEEKGKYQIIFSGHQKKATMKINVMSMTLEKKQFFIKYKYVLI